MVEKGADFGRSYTYDRSGLQVGRTRDGSYEVVCVASGTPAESAGLLAGDVITAVDGKSPGELGGLQALRGLLRASPGTRHSLTILRDGAQLDAALVIAELF
ncbi:MAG: PDZ domain-containing protein [bacterium]